MHDNSYVLQIAPSLSGFVFGFIAIHAATKKLLSLLLISPGFIICILPLVKIVPFLGFIAMLLIWTFGNGFAP